MDNSHLLWRLRNNDTAKDLCRLAADEIERLNAALAPTEPKSPLLQAIEKARGGTAAPPKRSFA